jgi:ribonuclease HI
MPSAGSKRKREPKFYAVRFGKTPGVYHTWEDCSAQIRGFTGASFKSFPTLTEAEGFVRHGAAGSLEGKVTKWYGVQAGRVPGIYTSWEDVQDQITGWKGPRYRAFKSKFEAEQFVKEPHNSPGLSAGTAEEGGEASEPASKKAKTAKSKKPNTTREEDGLTALADQGEYEPGEAPLGDDVEDGFDPSVILDPKTGTLRYRTREERQKTTYEATHAAPGAPIRIYTDGSALGNGRDSALGGVGVYFGPGDERNVSEPLTGTRQTNNRAELTAVQRALEVAPRDRRIVIVSDSKYAIDCVTDWFRNWQRNNWMNSSRKPVENKDLVIKIIDLLEERQRVNRHRLADGDNAAADAATKADQRAYWNRGPGGVLFEWVKGHHKDASNEAADQLAVAGARTAQALHEVGDLES